jgi:hypothetical protein
MEEMDLGARAPVAAVEEAEQADDPTAQTGLLPQFAQRRLTGHLTDLGQAARQRPAAIVTPLGQPRISSAIRYIAWRRSSLIALPPDRPRPS